MLRAAIRYALLPVILTTTLVGVASPVWGFDNPTEILCIQELGSRLDATLGREDLRLRMIADCAQAHDNPAYATEERRKADWLEQTWAAAERREQEKRAAEAVQRAADEARAKRPGVVIGMTAEQVRRETSWGDPDHINRTVTATGEREQWVYGGGYLYFDQGILVAIQSTRS